MKNIYGIIIVVLIIVSTMFYWYEYRPSAIYKKCNVVRTDFISLNNEKYKTNTFEFSPAANHAYESCLRDHGLSE